MSDIHEEICDLSIKLGSCIEFGEVKAIENALNNALNPTLIVNAHLGRLKITPLQLAAARLGEQEATSIVQLLIKHGAKVGKMHVNVQCISNQQLQCNRK